MTTNLRTPRCVARPGAWPLKPGRPVRLRLREDATLRGGHGMLWVTFERTGQEGDSDFGDHILEAGHRLHIPAGETVVIGAFGPRDADASFDWEPIGAAAGSVRPRWRDALVQLFASFGRPLVPAR